VTRPTVFKTVRCTGPDLWVYDFTDRPGHRSGTASGTRVRETVRARTAPTAGDGRGQSVSAGHRRAPCERASTEQSRRCTAQGWSRRMGAAPARTTARFTPACRSPDGHEISGGRRHAECGAGRLSLAVEREPPASPRGQERSCCLVASRARAAAFPLVPAVPPTGAVETPQVYRPATPGTRWSDNRRVGRRKRQLVKADVEVHRVGLRPPQLLRHPGRGPDVPPEDGAPEAWGVLLDLVDHRPVNASTCCSQPPSTLNGVPEQERVDGVQDRWAYRL